MPANERQPTRIREMMEHLGVEPGCGARSRLCLSDLTAFHRCENCTAKDVCCEWLANHAKARVAPAFCPNVDILFEMRCEQPRVGDATSYAAVTPAKNPPDEI
jgi:hypothetical protein